MGLEFFRLANPEYFGFFDIFDHVQHPGFPVRVDQDVASGLPRDAALYRLGELFVEEDQPEKARLYFEMLVEEFPESPFLSDARQRLSELG